MYFCMKIVSETCCTYTLNMWLTSARIHVLLSMKVLLNFSGFSIGNNFRNILHECCIWFSVMFNTKTSAWLRCDSILLELVFYKAISVTTIHLTITVTMSISIFQTCRSWVATSHLRPSMTFYLTTHPTCQGLLLLWMFYSEGSAIFHSASRAGVCQGTFEIISKKVLWSARGSFQTIRDPPLPNVAHSGG